MDNTTLYSIKMRASSKGRHVSGAEGIYNKGEIGEVVSGYCERAMKHARGEPDEIHITVGALREEPLLIPSLRVFTVRIASVHEAMDFIRRFLLSAGVSNKSVEEAFGVVYDKKDMRGAALVSVQRGNRREPDGRRGVRATEIGIKDEASEALSRKLSAYNLDNDTVKEALMLASKVAFSREVLAELCVSDDPDYTTGYIAMQDIGYVRIPNIKRRGEETGGRVFFVIENAHIDYLIEYLERKPVLIDRISDVYGEVSNDGFVGSSDSKPCCGFVQKK